MPVFTWIKPRLGSPMGPGGYRHPKEKRHLRLETNMEIVGTPWLQVADSPRSKHLLCRQVAPVRSAAVPPARDSVVEG